VEFAENGTDVVRAERLFGFGTANGSLAASESFLLKPGRYLIGLSQAGVSGDYVVNLWPTPLSQGRTVYREDRSHTGAFKVFAPLSDVVTVSFTIPEEQAGYVWGVDFQAPLGTATRLAIEGHDGVVTTAQATGAAPVRLSNLGLAPGEYRARVEPSTHASGGFVTFGLEAMGRATDGVEVEPNDRWEDASWFPLGGGVSGVAEGTDYFVFEVPADAVDGGAGASGGGTAGAAGVWDLNLESTAELQLQLFDSDRQLLQTRRGAWGTMRALHLDPGTYFVMVRGGDDAQ